MKMQAFLYMQVLIQLIYHSCALFNTSAFVATVAPSSTPEKNKRGKRRTYLTFFYQLSLMQRAIESASSACSIRKRR